MFCVSNQTLPSKSSSETATTTPSTVWALSPVRTTLEAMELFLAILALILSATSLLWQVAAHFLEGDRVTVTEGTSIPIDRLSNIPDCRFITASNRGRTAVTVSSIALDIGRNRTAQIGISLIPELSDQLPARLEPGMSATWNFPLSIATDVQNNFPRARGMVKLATGKTCYARRSSTR